MRNLATDIIPLMNFLKPEKDQIDIYDVFKKSKYVMDIELKDNGLDILKESTRGIISYYKGSDPIIFPLEKYIGKVISPLKTTKIVGCEMSSFQEECYNKFISSDDIKIQSLETSSLSQSICNFVFPVIEDNKIIGQSTRKAVQRLKNNIKYNTNKLLTLMQKKFKIHKDDINDFVYVSDKNKIITGKIYNEKYLKIFSNKLYQIYNNINNNYYNKNGTGTSFIYSNLVEIGINIFEEILLQNGYIEYKENGKYYSLDNVKCSYCGHTKKDHHNSPDKKHKYTPATYIIFTGQKIENIDSAKKEELRAIFNSPNNKDGQIIKLLLGSIVMSEGITLKNIKDIHIMDAHLNKSRLIQAVGRGVRNCSHIDVTSINNQYPEVKVYTYCSLLSNNKISSELIIYRHAEIKQEQIKKIENVLKRNAIDCPLNFEINKKGEPSDFKCFESCLNDAYWDTKKKYIKIYQ